MGALVSYSSRVSEHHLLTSPLQGEYEAALTIYDSHVSAYTPFTCNWSLSLITSEPVDSVLARANGGRMPLDFVGLAVVKSHVLTPCTVESLLTRLSSL